LKVAIDKDIVVPIYRVSGVAALPSGCPREKGPRLPALDGAGRIEDAPLSCAIAIEAEGVRKARVKRSPYSIAYRVLTEDEIEIDLPPFSRRRWRSGRGGRGSVVSASIRSSARRAM
jgi:hypothetical protein